jgi:hypothetical protein
MRAPSTRSGDDEDADRRTRHRYVPAARIAFLSARSGKAPPEDWRAFGRRSLGDLLLFAVSYADALEADIKDLKVSRQNYFYSLLDARYRELIAKQAFRVVGWSGRQDLNLRPPGPEPDQAHSPSVASLVTVAYPLDGAKDPDSCGPRNPIDATESDAGFGPTVAPPLRPVILPETLLRLEDVAGFALARKATRQRRA